jgi:hypothetical protein
MPSTWWATSPGGEPPEPLGEPVETKPPLGEPVQTKPPLGEPVETEPDG